MSDWNPRANDIFLDARDVPVGPARDKYLSDVCQDDQSLLADVLALLDAEQQAGQFLESGAVDISIGIDPRAEIEQPGDSTGPYKLLQEIGEGGMGLVFLAEQSLPVRRQVALKIIKPGMDSRQVIARFEAERQALALMDHPNIAKVLDAGTTAAGRPFFVMELVKGVPITRYCDEQRLTVAERLELFLPVCHAVQHAHQKGIIHRDLKPSNVLIALYDGRPAPKVIDFGVAKAVGPKLTDRTMFTEFGTVVGTLEYMSPEQAELNQLDVDTRSDVYSLGVLLYELMVGSTPLESKRARSVSWDEARRIIREEEPPKPSTRIGSSATLPALAARRQLDSRKLAEQIRGDLDWIAMKAIEKARDRRYETADALARDIERYRSCEPIEARPPSAWYRFSKFAHRNRGPVSAAGLLSLALLVGIIVSTWEAYRAIRAERAALVNAEEAQHARENEAAQRAKAEDMLQFMVVALGSNASEFDSRHVDQLIARSTQEFQHALPNAPSAKAALMLNFGRSFHSSRRFLEAERVLRFCLQLADDDQTKEDARYLLASSLLRLGNTAEGTALFRLLLEKKLEHISGRDVTELRAAWPGLANAAASPTDRPGQDGLSLDGQHDYVVLPNLQFDGRPPWTLEVIANAIELDQFKSRAAANWTSLISTADGGGIALESNQGKWSIGLYAPKVYSDRWEDNYLSAIARDKPRLNRWVHIAGVWDGNELRLYVDGELQGLQKDVKQCSSLSEGPFLIGADPCDLKIGYVAEGLFHGVFRAARISRGVEYSKSFTSPTRLAATPTTVALYDFTIDTGRYAIDRSGNGCHGIIVGAKFLKATK